jgi:hypothetical protein
LLKSHVAWEIMRYASKKLMCKRLRFLCTFLKESNSDSAGGWLCAPWINQLSRRTVLCFILSWGMKSTYYLLALLDFHHCFSNQMIWEYQWQLTTLCTRSMIAFACGMKLVTCSWFGFNTIIVTHLIEPTLEFAPLSATIHWGLG